jgi:DNA polymerase-3 subunit delta
LADSPSDNLGMPISQHVFEFLAKPVGEIPTGVCALYGSERFLKTLALRHLTGADVEDNQSEFSATKYDAANASWPDVYDELSTKSLFGGDGPRIVIVDDADKFVSENRSRLEKFAEGTGGTGLLVLIVDTWLKSTKLYKRVSLHGMQIDCGPPKKSARSKTADPTKVCTWLVNRAKQSHGFELPKQGAQLLFDLTECEFGRMEQELNKIALFANDKGKVSMETIKQSVGGWRTRTMWDAVDAALAGDAGKALDLLDLIFRGGEHPLALFGSLSWSLRRYANATEEILRQMRSGRKPNMQTALKSAGLGGWGGENAEAQLKQIGSGRAKQLSQWLLEADLQLKRSHSHETRGRLVLEKLFLRLAKELKTAA